MLLSSIPRRHQADRVIITRPRLDTLTLYHFRNGKSGALSVLGRGVFKSSQSNRKLAGWLLFGGQARRRRQRPSAMPVLHEAVIALQCAKAKLDEPNAASTMAARLRAIRRREFLDGMAGAYITSAVAHQPRSSQGMYLGALLAIR